MTHADQIEATLAEHELWSGGGWVKPTCSCDGWTTGDRFYEEIHAAHRAHVAAVLAALTPEPVAGGLTLTEAERESLGDAMFSAMFSHQRIPIYALSNPAANQCSGCGHMHGDQCGPNSPSHVRHQIDMALPAVEQIIAARAVPVPAETDGEVEALARRIYFGVERTIHDHREWVGDRGKFMVPTNILWAALSGQVRRPAETDGLAERVRDWLPSHQASVAITDALTEREVYLLRPKVREILREASRALLDVAAPAPEGER